jgi:DNA-binding HxlR family transcriptional regulator
LRTVSPDTPVRVQYSLTEKGRALREPLATIAEWAGEWMSAPEE